MGDFQLYLPFLSYPAFTNGLLELGSYAGADYSWID
jgi:hypothetical protein